MDNPYPQEPLNCLGWQASGRMPVSLGALRFLFLPCLFMSWWFFAGWSRRMSFFSPSFITGFPLCQRLAQATLPPTLSLFLTSASASSLFCCLTALSPYFLFLLLCSHRCCQQITVKAFPANSDLIRCSSSARLAVFVATCSGAHSEP